ncbi:hypothetical protein LZP85_06900 [Priestia flexa]|uniref:hypothetical protein n=1 Tax=Priestia TaxID=2800373 RepID=UPI001F30F002|nr:MULTISPECIES: hypothetical protein [Priestia]MDN3362211.1 hypothetical protein [Priestia megaterium]MDT0149532.1 hypothetical protein [Priestia aryabhattai]MDT0154818.1 hypothetical protein [Priestia aryabhattai]UIR31506.1 hypothetical protein LZP85_06900 [Priestia flexa]
MKYYYIMGQKELRSDRKGNKVFNPITGMYAQGNSVGEMLYNAGKAIPKFMDDFNSIQWTELDEGYVQEVLKRGIKFADGTI